MEGTSEVAVGSELVWMVWSLEGLGLRARRGRRAGARQGKLGKGPRVGKTMQGRNPGEVLLVGRGRAGLSC